MPPRKRKLSDSEETIKKEGIVETSENANKKNKQTFSIFNKKESATEKKSNEELNYGLEWAEHGEKIKNLSPLFYLHSKNLEGRSKIAAFDIDFTIIKTKSGKKFPTDASDWTWFDKSVVVKLKELDCSGYRIIFVTNQAGIEKGKVKFLELKSKFQSIILALDVPIFLFVSTGENHYRKPSTEIWNFFISSCNQKIEVDMKESFYVGDAAGRPKNWSVGKSKDFSCVDRMFAYNIGLKFHTPEEFFLNQKVAQFEWRSINPLEVLKKYKPEDQQTEYHKKEKEMVILVGPPASGKSTFAKKYLLPHNYVHVNRDTLGTVKKCLDVVEDSFKNDKSVVIDNTNPSKESRAEFIKIAKKHNIKSIRCFRMTTLLELCFHLNYVRQNQSKGTIRRIPDVGYNTYKSKQEDPIKTEGFTEILQIDFKPEFDSEEHERIFKQWTD